MRHTITFNIPTKDELIDEYRKLKTLFERKYLLFEEKLFKNRGKSFWKLSYKLTGRCGSRIDGHYPVFGNHRWLWKFRGNADKLYATCSICGEKQINKRHKGNIFRNYSKRGRESDVSELKRMRKTATNDAERRAIDRNLHKINFETKEARAMRESLIVATRKNDQKEIKEIHENIAGKRKYTNE